MSELNQYFCETHIIGERCRQNQLDCEHFPVLQEAPFRWLGYSVLEAPYRMVRLRSVHSHIVVCVDGIGNVLIDGEPVEFIPGQVMLGPVGAHHAFEANGTDPWTIAWVFYDDSVESPVLRARRAQLMVPESGTDTFVTTLQLLLREAAGPEQPAAMSALVNLLDIHTRRMVGLDAIDERMVKLWLKVEGRLAEPWTVAKLAQIACVSEEHLRRLCHHSYQRSPMDHLTQLRLRRASTLLRSTGHKVDLIAQSVGYASMYSFSVAFKRWCGVAPREFRRGSNTTLAGA